MATTMLETLGTIRTDGTLDLDQRVTIPPGRVKVRLESVERPVQAAQGLVEFVQGLRQQMTDAGHQFRTKEAIDAEMEALRNDWDE